MNDIVWLTLRRLRTPLIVMIVVYSLSVFGLLMIPGVDEVGGPYKLHFLDAAYFVAIMATTIGFGEIPYSFTEAQRLYAYIIIVPNVTAWLYSIGTILALFLDPQFQAVLRRGRFARKVRTMVKPFYIVCGFGSTGSMITRGLGRRGLAAVVVERDETVLHSMMLLDEFAHIPMLPADVSDRRILELAGLNHQHCRGVIAATNEDHANLTIAITVKLLRPDLQVIARSETERTSRNMASFGTDHIVDPYAIFAERMFLALNSPIKYLIQDWLISVPGSKLRTQLNPPQGRWILCGLGRFGTRLKERLLETGLPLTLVDVHPERLEGHESAVLGRGTEAHTLHEAGIEEASALVAGTGDDVDNLSIVMTAKELNPHLFIVARQERQPNDELFDASGADLVARRGLIVARRVLAIATTPLLMPFLEHVIRQPDEFAQRVAHRCEAALQGISRSLWTLETGGELGRGLALASQEGVHVRLTHLTHNARSEHSEPLACVCLVLERGASRIYLPGKDQEILQGDRLLLTGREVARREMMWALRAPDMLIASVTGRHLPSGSLARWLHRRRRQRAGSSQSA